MLSWYETLDSWFAGEEVPEEIASKPFWQALLLEDCVVEVSIDPDFTFTSIFEEPEDRGFIPKEQAPKPLELLFNPANPEKPWKMPPPYGNKNCGSYQ